jgi:hypothetical protein
MGWRRRRQGREMAMVIWRMGWEARVKSSKGDISG